MAKASLTDRKVREMMNADSMPNFAQINLNTASFKSDYARALDWIHHSVEDEDLKKELVTYLQFTNRMEDVALVKHLDGVQIKTLGTISFCLNRGAELEPKSLLRITNAFDQVRNQPVVDMDGAEFETLPDTARARNTEAYVSCYSRLDNLRALVCMGKVDLKNVHAEAMKILDAQGGLKPAVRKQLVDHYTQSVAEAQEDKVLKAWIKPLQLILRAVAGDAKTSKAAPKVEKVAKAAKTGKKVAPKADKVANKAAAKPVAKGGKKVATKPVAKRKPNTTRTVTIQAQREAGKPSIAAQVRDLIRANKGESMDGMFAIVARELGLNKERSRSAVKANWEKAAV